MAAFAVHVFCVTVDAVAALYLGDGGSCVGGRTQGIRVVSHAAAKLDIILVPVPPQNRLDLTRENTFQFSYFNATAYETVFTLFAFNVKV